MSKASNITLAQAQSLVDQGAMTKKGFAKLVEEGQIKIFRFRTQDNKPEVVQEVHNNIVAMIEERAYALYEAGFKPSIVWNKVNTEEAEEATDSPV